MQPPLTSINAHENSSFWLPRYTTKCPATNSYHPRLIALQSQKTVDLQGILIVALR